MELVLLVRELGVDRPKGLEDDGEGRLREEAKEHGGGRASL